MEEALRARFLDAEVINSQAELADILEKVGRAIEDPASIPVCLSTCAGRHMKSKSGQCCARYRQAKRPTTVILQPNSALAMRER
jgi:hypothetical protein